MIADLRIIDGRLTIIDQAAGEPFSTDLAPIDLELAEFSTLPDRSGRQQVTIRTESGAEIGLTGSLSVNPLALAGQVRLEGTYTPMLFRYFRDELALPLTFDGGAITARLDYRVAMDEDGELSVGLSNVTGGPQRPEREPARASASGGARHPEPGRRQLPLAGA